MQTADLAAGPDARCISTDAGIPRGYDVGRAASLALKIDS
jgi:hypothetical protein